MSSLPEKIIISEADLLCLWEIVLVPVEQCRDQHFAFLSIVVLHGDNPQGPTGAEDLDGGSGILRCQGWDPGLHRE